MFEAIFNSIYYQMFMPIISVLALVLLSVTIFVGIRFKGKAVKTLSLVLALFFIFIVYEGILYFYAAKAVLANNKDEMVLNYDRAIKYSVLPEQKGVLYIEKSKSLAAMGFGEEALKNYEKAYLYHQTYDKLSDSLAGLIYIRSENYDKSIEIYEKIQDYGMLSYIYRLKGDYNKALEYANKQLEFSQERTSYIGRAIVYRYLGCDSLAQKDYEKALSLCPDDGCKNAFKKRSEQYQKFDRKQHETARQRLGFEGSF